MSNPYSVTTVKCAGPGCEAVRREANHWFVISTVQGRFVSEPFDRWGNLAVNDMPVCGQACAQKLFEQWMAEQSEEEKLLETE